MVTKVGRYGGNVDVPHRRRLAYVNDDVPQETTELVRVACGVRNIDFVEVHAPSFDYRPEWQLDSGDLLFRPATSVAAMRVEQFLYARGVGTLYTPPENIYFQYSAAVILHQRANLPIPRTIYCSTADRSRLRSYVAELGGFPVLVKLPGYSRGIGVIRADSMPALVSLVDYLRTIGANPALSAYVPEAIHWRLTVIGKRVVSAYRNRLEEDDFRTYASDDIADYTQKWSMEMEKLAVRAVEALRVDFGGVDILAHATGRLYLLEANFPAYFANAQRIGGIDISGMLVDHLVLKSNDTQFKSALI